MPLYQRFDTLQLAAVQYLTGCGVDGLEALAAAPDVKLPAVECRREVAIAVVVFQPDAWLLWVFYRYLSATSRYQLVQSDC